MCSACWLCGTLLRLVTRFCLLSSHHLMHLNNGNVPNWFQMHKVGVSHEGCNGMLTGFCSRVVMDFCWLKPCWKHHNHGFLPTHHLSHLSKSHCNQPVTTINCLDHIVLIKHKRSSQLCHWLLWHWVWKLAFNMILHESFHRIIFCSDRHKLGPKEWVGPLVQIVSILSGNCLHQDAHWTNNASVRMHCLLTHVFLSESGFQIQLKTFTPIERQCLTSHCSNLSPCDGKIVDPMQWWTNVWSWQFV